MAGDMAEVRAIIEEVYGALAGHFPPAIWRRYRAELTELTADSQGRGGVLLVAQRGSALLGTVTFYPVGAEDGHGWPAPYASFRLLAVPPAARGQGVGRTLVAGCIDRAAAAGRRALGLHTAPFMTEAIALYEAMGFTRSPAHDFTARDVYGRSDDVDTVPGLAYVRPVPQETAGVPPGPQG